MKYLALPFEIDATEIISVQLWMNGAAILGLDADSAVHNADGGVTVTYPSVFADPSMLARYVPEAGDYYVTHSDGFITVMPKHVFIRTYIPKGE